jgi:hypothetical protein
VFLDAIRSKQAGPVTAAVPLLFQWSKEPAMLAALKEQDTISSLVALLDFPDRTGILVAFTLLPIFLDNGKCAPEGPHMTMTGDD